ncbi:hypothetical protein AB9K34_05640 [Sedimentitalea sp. XS_ASV28]|uniref:hypothetical protein n=1 Tax=Sedimentitalea sp. XS_ASV28 TaxID=3241296 RepID=UPI0035153082
MTVFFFFATILLVSIISAIVAAGVAAQPPLLSLMGPFSAGFLGLAICALLATGLLFMLDPDPVTGLDAPLPRLMRTLPITGLAAVLWLPVFLSLFGRLRRVRAAE